MAEEFQESEVLFPQEHETELQHSAEEEAEDKYAFQIGHFNNKVSMIRNVIMNQDTDSVPMNKASWFTEIKYNEFVDDEMEMVPPHLIIKRRIARKMMAFSICTGYERTLKGRNLRQTEPSTNSSS
ncbi:protein S40-3 [Solanum dulcamara]|uniref:protein S40-3 n=1 Tax=Solanum dulcamara TaxID=45834 RepID=UPI002486919B|nr:protein S40-3 [Solanum dulcamara]